MWICCVVGGLLYVTAIIHSFLHRWYIAIIVSIVTYLWKEGEGRESAGVREGGSEGGREGGGRE